MSDRFAYRYWVDHGLFEIQYDPSGVKRFDVRRLSDNQAYSAWEPFTYRLAYGRSFLRCRGGGA